MVVISLIVLVSVTSTSFTVTKMQSLAYRSHGLPENGDCSLLIDQ